MEGILVLSPTVHLPQQGLLLDLLLHEKDDSTRGQLMLLSNSALPEQ